MDWKVEPNLMMWIYLIKSGLNMMRKRKLPLGSMRLNTSLPARNNIKMLYLIHDVKYMFCIVSVFIYSSSFFCFSSNDGTHNLSSFSFRRFSKSCCC